MSRGSALKLSSVSNLWTELYPVCHAVRTELWHTGHLHCWGTPHTQEPQQYMVKVSNYSLPHRHHWLRAASTLASASSQRSARMLAPLSHHIRFCSPSDQMGRKTDWSWWTFHPCTHILKFFLHTWENHSVQNRGDLCSRTHTLSQTEIIILSLFPVTQTGLGESLCSGTLEE